MIERSKSKQAYERLCEVLPGGVDSPVRACKGLLQTPMVVASAAHDKLTDVDGNSYIDYCCSWGALIHGHTHPRILGAAQKAMAQGTSFGITTEIEGELARKIIELVPSIEKIRFVSSGTEATMSAIRLARGFTNREYVIKFSGNYHGHADFFLVQAGSGVLNLSPTSSSAGIPHEIVKYTVCLPYNDVETCRDFLKSPAMQQHLAAIIIEPIAGNMGVVPASPQFLNMLREETKRLGALFVFDEVITGFRVASGGAQELYKIKPDLTCFGKIMGGGFPAAAFGGRRDVMDFLAPLGPVYQAGTLSGNPVAMAAGLEALKMIGSGFYADLERKAHVITQPVRHALQKKNIKACVQQVGSMFSIFFGQNSIESLEDLLRIDVEKFAKFFRFLFERGVYIPPSPHEAWFVSSVHTNEHLNITRDLILEFIETH